MPTDLLTTCIGLLFLLGAFAWYWPIATELGRKTFYAKHQHKPYLANFAILGGLQFVMAFIQVMMLAVILFSLSATVRNVLFNAGIVQSALLVAVSAALFMTSAIFYGYRSTARAAQHPSSPKAH